MRRISIRELHIDSGRWVRDAAERGPLIITERGRPIAAFQPYAPRLAGRVRRIGAAADLLRHCAYSYVQPARAPGRELPAHWESQKAWTRRMAKFPDIEIVRGPAGDAKARCRHSKTELVPNQGGTTRTTYATSCTAPRVAQTRASG